MPVTYEPIATTTLGTAAATITLSSIPGTYTDLRIVFNGNLSGGTGILYIRPLASTSAIYSQTYMVGNGSSASSNSTTSKTYWSFSEFDSMSTTIPVFVTTDIFNYANTSINKTALITGSFDKNGTGVVTRSVGLFRSTSAITSIRFANDTGNNFAVGTTVTLYGIKAA